MISKQFREKIVDSKYFDQFGEAISTYHSDTCIFIEFKKAASAAEAISKTKHQIGNAEINVKEAYKNNQNKIQALGREEIRLNYKMYSGSVKMNIEDLQMHSDSETNDSNNNLIEIKYTNFG